MPTILWGKSTGGDIVIPWAGHCLLEGCRLVGAGGTDDDVLLDWCQFETDENTIGLWHMNEAAWEGLPDEVVDASGHGHHGRAVNGATTAEGWLDRAGRFNGTNQRVTLGLNPISQGDLAGGYTIEAWLKLNSKPAVEMRALSLEACLCLGWRRTGVDAWFVHHYAVETGGANNFLIGSTAPAPGSWYHVAATWDGAQIRLWVNGAAEGTPIGETHPVALDYFSREDWFGGNPYGGGQHWFAGGVDEVRLSSIQRYTSDFSPTRYPDAGAVTARYSPAVPQRLTAIAWDGVFGPSTGRLRRLWVYSGGDWRQVGGEYPTSPITGLNMPVAGPDLVRVEMEPKDDVLQSETPTLDWLQVTLEAVPAPSRRTRIAAALDRQRLGATAGARLAALLERDRLDTRSD